MVTSLSTNLQEVGGSDALVKQHCVDVIAKSRLWDSYSIKFPADWAKKLEETKKTCERNVEMNKEFEKYISQQQCVDLLSVQTEDDKEWKFTLCNHWLDTGWLEVIIAK